MKASEAREAMGEAAILWSVGYVEAATLVDAACHLLVTGHDGLHLSMLAGVHRRHAEQEAPDFVEGALTEIGLDFHPPGSRSGAEAAVGILAGRVLSGRLEPSALTVWAHDTFGHGTLPLADRLVELDDVYGIVDYDGREQYDAVDADVLTEARRIIDVRRPAAPTELERLRPEDDPHVPA